MKFVPKQKPGRSKQDYETPKDLLDAIKERLGIKVFAFDFACSKENKKALRGWTKIDNSLSKPAWLWAQQTGSSWGWLNPPFAKIEPWAKACNNARANGARIAFLVPASVGSNWFLHYIWQEPNVTVIYLNGRPSFDGVAGYPKDCMLVLFDGLQTDDEFNSGVWTWKE